jgi:hypothetical protein
MRTEQQHTSESGRAYVYATHWFGSASYDFGGSCSSSVVAVHLKIHVRAAPLRRLTDSVVVSSAEMMTGPRNMTCSAWGATLHAHMQARAYRWQAGRCTTCLPPAHMHGATYHTWYSTWTRHEAVLLLCISILPVFSRAHVQFVPPAPTFFSCAHVQFLPSCLQSELNLAG